MRIYMEILDRHIKNGHNSNWIESEVTGAVYCAMVLQDYERVSRFVFGNGGDLANSGRAAVFHNRAIFKQCIFSCFTFSPGA